MPCRPQVRCGSRRCWKIKATFSLLELPRALTQSQRAHADRPHFHWKDLILPEGQQKNQMEAKRGMEGGDTGPEQGAAWGVLLCGRCSREQVRSHRCVPFIPGPIPPAAKAHRPSTNLSCLEQGILAAKSWLWCLWERQGVGRWVWA